MQAQQPEGIIARTDISDGRQDCDLGSYVPKNEVMKSNQNGRSGKTRTRSGQMRHRPESRRFDQQ